MDKRPFAYANADLSECIFPVPNIRIRISKLERSCNGDLAVVLHDRCAWRAAAAGGADLVDAKRDGGLWRAEVGGLVRGSVSGGSRGGGDGALDGGAVENVDLVA